MTLTKTTFVALGASMLLAASCIPYLASAHTDPNLPGHTEGHASTSTATSTASSTVVVTATTTATSSANSNAALLTKIQSLMKLIAELKLQLSTAKGDLEEMIKDGLVEGVQDEDIKKIQALLASDKEIYPEGKITGFFGPLTREAIKRFQTRYELEVTGKLDEDTRELMKELFKERQGGTVPPGLLKSTEARKRVMDHLQAKWGEDCDLSIPGRGNRCAKPWKDDKGKDKDDNATSTATTSATTSATRSDAGAAVATAQEAINELEEVIEDADTSEDEIDSAVEDAQQVLDQAMDDLDDARADLNSKDFQSAYDLAMDVEEEVSDAMEDLEEVIEEVEDDN